MKKSLTRMVEAMIAEDTTTATTEFHAYLNEAMTKVFEMEDVDLKLSTDAPEDTDEELEDDDDCSCDKDKDMDDESEDDDEYDEEMDAE